LFDLGQLTIPAGQSTAQYQLSVEALDPNWSRRGAVCSDTSDALGFFRSGCLTIQSGSNVEQDILMLQSEVAQAHPGSGTSYATPGALPLEGDGVVDFGYGSTIFSNLRSKQPTASVSVIAVDETDSHGIQAAACHRMWQLSDESGIPRLHPPPRIQFGDVCMSRLDAQFSVSVRSGWRGRLPRRREARLLLPARLLYSDTVTRRA